MGTVQNEALLFIYQAAAGSEVSELEYYLVLGLVFGDDFREVERMYPPGSVFEHHDERPVLSRVLFFFFAPVEDSFFIS